MEPINNMDHQETDGHTNQKEFLRESDFEIDDTIVDVYLVSSLDRNKIIGSPVVVKRLD